MTNDLERKLLAEAFDALVNDNDIAKATRLFKRQWDLKAKNCYSLLEAEDESFEVSDMGDELNSEISNDEIDSRNEASDQTMVAIDELEEKYPGELPDDVRGKLDELRNIVDERKLSDGDDEEASSDDDALAIIEDLKADYEMAGAADDEEINDLFDEIFSHFQDGSEVEELDVEDDDSDFDFEEDVKVEEAEGDDLVSDLEAEGEDEIEAGIEDEMDAHEMGEDSEGTVEVSEETYDDLMDILNRLEAENGSEDAIEEGWSNIADPRKKMTSEDEGVNKKGTMNFGKLSDMKLNKKPRLGVSSTDSKGESADKKVKVQSTENKGAKQWHKVEKPANKPAAGKSMMGN